MPSKKVWQEDVKYGCEGGARIGVWKKKGIAMLPHMKKLTDTRPKDAVGVPKIFLELKKTMLLSNEIFPLRELEWQDGKS